MITTYLVMYTSRLSPLHHFVVCVVHGYCMTFGETDTTIFPRLVEI